MPAARVAGGLAALVGGASPPPARSSLLAAAVRAPVLAVALYRFSGRGSIEAMRLALTDQLTGLGN